MTFQDVDVSRMMERFRLGARGKRRGESNEPFSDSANLDEVEREIIDFAVNERKKSFDQFLQHQRAFAARLHEQDLAGAVVDIKNQAKKVLADFDVRSGQGLDQLNSLRASFEEAKHDLSHFQQEHNRVRAAQSKPMLWMAVSIGVMITIFALESYFNGNLLGQGTIAGVSSGIAYPWGFPLSTSLREYSSG
ncbi:MAG: hypothetical protein K2P94_03600 [Rhodospirillaceae bacterium]|nr:hypothetical protein [Rhodospirillaceae bacterium]